MSQIQLTKDLSVRDGGHILYFYKTDGAYIENAESFIITGVELNQHVIFIDKQERCQRILDNLRAKIDVSKVQFINSYDFYETYHDFQYDRVLTNLEIVLEPYVKDRRIVRLWGYVEPREQADFINEINTYETSADVCISELGYTTVCAYDAQHTPAYVQTDLMAQHEFFMTDYQLLRSNLYRHSTMTNQVVFPSISVQRNVESEMDLYKQKLDFVHVVSHEVRNPLTVIKAYASLLARDEKDEERRAKLNDITRYATVIDNEVTHIINTEEMLTTDAVWKKTLTMVCPAIEQAVEIMEVKAFTQNISLISDVELDGTELMLANLMGLKLIVTNLLSNAIKFSFEGQQVWLNIHKNVRTLKIIVTDKGIGMSPEQQSKLFKKYEKIHQDSAGQGIGLFMVKKLIEHFEGTIEVKSEMGRGSTFIIELPLRMGTKTPATSAYSTRPFQ